MFGFEKLEVWQKSVEFADQVYRCSTAFPTDERFGLKSQLHRSAVSVSSNIAEGSGRQSTNDFSRFLSIAYGSLMECVSQLHVAKRLQYINEETLQQQLLQAELIAKMLSRLRSSLNNK